MAEGSADVEVMRNFLISLGFKVDAPAQDKFEKTIQKADKSMSKLGKTLIGVAVGVEAMVEVFASKMEKLHYMSERANSSVTNLVAAGSGAERIGIAGEKMQASIENLARNIRLNPGIQAVIENLGVKVTGRDMSDVAADVVTQLKKMPFYQGAQFGQMFGMDPDTLFMLEEGIDKYKEAVEARKKLAADMGVNLEEASKAAVEYRNIWRDVGDRIETLGSALAVKLLPASKSVAIVVESLLEETIKLIALPETFKERYGLQRPGVDFKNPGKSGRVISEDQSKLGDVTSTTSPSQLSSTATSDKEKYLSDLEAQLGLPKGLLSSVWQQESGKGKNLVGPRTKTGERALGDFQLMSKTAKQYHVNVGDFYSSARGAAAMLSESYKRRGGNLDMTLADYNWGLGNLDKYSLGSAPPETKKYISDTEGRMGMTPSINQKTDIHIHGVADAGEAGRLVLNNQDRVNSKIVRDFVGAVN